MIVLQLGCGSDDPGVIVFQSHRPSDWNIYTINGDGTEETRLFTSRSNEWSPTISPDGSQIAFAAGPEEGFDIYVIADRRDQPAADHEPY